MKQVGRRDGGATATADAPDGANGEAGPLADGGETDDAADGPEPIRLDRNPLRPGGPIS